MSPVNGWRFSEKCGGAKCRVISFLSLGKLRNKNSSTKKSSNPIALRACGEKLSLWRQKTMKSGKIWWGRAQSWWGKTEGWWGSRPTNCRYRKLHPYSLHVFQMATTGIPRDVFAADLFPPTSFFQESSVVRSDGFRSRRHQVYARLVLNTINIVCV